MNPLTSLLRSAFPWVAAMTALLLAGCATTYVKVDRLANPPPSERSSSFQHFDVKPIRMDVPYAGQEANDKALVKIQENFDARVNPLLASWNAIADAKPKATLARTLRIEPYIEDIKFINATSHIWAGAMAGSSAVVLKIRFVDTLTGATVAEPEFFQRTAAMGGAWSFGATDNNKLVRIAELATDYLRANYDNAIGGPTGAVAQK